LQDIDEKTSEVYLGLIDRRNSGESHEYKNDDNRERRNHGKIGFFALQKYEKNNDNNRNQIGTKLGKEILKNTSKKQGDNNGNEKGNNKEHYDLH